MLISRIIKVFRSHATFSVSLCAMGIMVQMSPLSAEQLWATGVTQSSGWTYTAGAGTGYCWAAVCTNLVLHWQNELAKKYELPLNVPTTQNDIRNAFINESGFSAGYWVRDGIQWYIEKYFPTLQLPMPELPDIKDLNTHASEWCQEYSLSVFSTRIREILKAGEPIGMGLRNMIHANTIWGAQFNDDTGLLEKIWVTDTAGGTGSIEEWLVQAIPEELQETYYGYQVWFGQEGSGGSYSWGDIPDYLDYLTTDIKDLSGKTPTSLIPEPATASLSLLALGMLALRRRR